MVEGLKGDGKGKTSSFLPRVMRKQGIENRVVGTYYKMVIVGKGWIRWLVAGEVANFSWAQFLCGYF